MREWISVWWPVLSFFLGLFGFAIARYFNLYRSSQDDKMERIKEDGSEAQARVIGMLDELEGKMNDHEQRTSYRISEVDRKRREGDHELAQDMLALRQRMHDRFVTEKQFGEGMKRFDDMNKRVTSIEQKIDDLPGRIAKVIREENG